MKSFRQQYETAALLDLCTQDVCVDSTEHLKTIWELDSAIRLEFEGAIQLYKQGLTHSIEFVRALNFILDINRTPQS
jgi:hypothetical protein